jgi:hypothetical protein
VIERSVYEEACKVKYNYAFGVDLRDWDLYRSVLAEHLLIDFRGIGYRDVMHLTADEWIVEVRKLMDGLDASHHQMSGCVVDPDGETGLAMRTYVTAQHVLRTAGEADRFYQIGGWYDDRLRRVNGTWRLTQVAFNQTWAWGDSLVMKDAARRARDSSPS